MRNVVIAFASVAALSSLAAAASADPLPPADSLAAAAPTAERDTPSTYVLGGLMVGGNDGLLTAGGTVEAGKRVAPFAWAHASLTMGAASELFATGSGSLTQARVGADLMTCNRDGTVCAYAGADAGLQVSQYVGSSTPWFCGVDDGGCMPDAINESHSSAIGVARLGVDVGSKHVRWRPGLEASAATDGHAGLNLTQSILYRF